MAAARVFSGLLVLSLTLASCQSASQKASKDEVKVEQGVELVCSARNDVDQAVEAVYALTPQSTVDQAEQASKTLNKALKKLKRADQKLSKAELREYRDQVKIFRDAVDEVRRNKELTLAEAADQLKGKAEPVVAAKEQLMAITLCLNIEEPADDVDNKESHDKSSHENASDEQAEEQKKAEEKE